MLCGCVNVLKHPISNLIFKVTQVRKYSVLSSATSAIGVLAYLGGAISGDVGISWVAVTTLLLLAISSLSAIVSFICDELTRDRFNNPDNNPVISVYTLICVDFCALHFSIALMLLGMLVGFVHLYAISV